MRWPTRTLFWVALFAGALGYQLGVNDQKAKFVEKYQPVIERLDAHPGLNRLLRGY